MGRQKLVHTGWSRDDEGEGRGGRERTQPGRGGVETMRGRGGGGGDGRNQAGGSGTGRVRPCCGQDATAGHLLKLPAACLGQVECPPLRTASAQPRPRRTPVSPLSGEAVSPTHGQRAAGAVAGLSSPSLDAPSPRMTRLWSLGYLTDGRDKLRDARSIQNGRGQPGLVPGREATYGWSGPWERGCWGGERHRAAGHPAMDDRGDDGRGRNIISGWARGRPRR